MRFLIPLLLLAATPAYAAPTDGARYRACLALAKEDPPKAVDIAGAWRMDGGGVPARHCLGVAYTAQGKFSAATIVLEQAASAADEQKSPLAGALWGQAGNAALAADDADKALTFLDRALAAPLGSAVVRGSLLIDRARALGALDRAKEARADLDEAVKLVSAEPSGWLLRATLARREGRFADAEASIAEALSRAPLDPDVLLESGNIAAVQGKGDEARTVWAKAVKAAPDSSAGKAAAAAIRANGGQ